MENMKKRNKNILSKILIFFGTLPFLFLLLLAIKYSITGFDFMFSTSYGFEAFLGTIGIFLFLFWPIYVVGALFIVIGIVCALVIKHRRKHNKV